jgi:hypothetical protein
MSRTLGFIDRILRRWRIAWYCHSELPAHGSASGDYKQKCNCQIPAKSLFLAELTSMEAIG